MTRCRICREPLPREAYLAPAPSLTSTTTIIDAPTRVFVCATCGHAQSDDLSAAQDFYDTQYRISLQSEDDDQLYAFIDGTPVYRTDHQAALVLSHAQPAKGAAVLDYGAAKAATLKKLAALRNDLSPHVFDVSADYLRYWESWLPVDRCATYTLPEAWTGRFDLVTAHFVLEHVNDPIAILRSIRRQLKPGGSLFLSVPNPIANPGDLIVVDHVSHFTEPSLRWALGEAGFGTVRIDPEGFAGGFVVTATAQASPDPAHGSPGATRDALLQICDFWSKARQRLAAAAARHGKRPCAIYGAGFYGSYIAACIGEAADLRCFVDRNPHVRAAPHLGRPVVAPEDLPSDIAVVYAGLNPNRAREILADVPEWRGRRIEFVFLD